eukprot:TRINITY_DN5702_c0_g1_i1.p1 TRINITY_DN5702_c0_g1~~TRINITY_DN5702_c0_g1_i1.p1  ORF type:complete len:592 (+),score=138.97 TRINITY_DN5702_c0_g1_i1:1728-3503(+)
MLRCKLMATRRGTHRWYCKPPTPNAPIDTEDVLMTLAKTIAEDQNTARKLADSPYLEGLGDKLNKALAESTEVVSEVTAPTLAQLRQASLAASIPFIGFGILDNMLMIICGDWIDTTLCVSLGFSTMAAAALGNTISDAGGVYSGGVVEDWAAKWGIESPPLTRAQEALPQTRMWERLGQLIGVVLGCLLGMFPLMLIDARKGEKLKQEKNMDEMYQTVVESVSEMLDAEAAILMLVDHEENELYTRARDKVPEFRSPVGEGVKGAVAMSGQFMNIGDIRTTEYFSEERHVNYQGTGISVVSVLCMPVIGPDNKVLGVVEVINKKLSPEFTEKDEDVLSALCSHISTAMCSADGSEHAFKQTIELCERSLKNRGTRLNTAQNARIEFLFGQVVEEVTAAVKAEAAQLLVLDRNTKELYTKVSDKLPAFRSPVSKGIMGEVVTSGQVVCVPDVRESIYFDESRHMNYQGTGMNVRSVLCHPILDEENDVIAVIEVINKQQKASEREFGFTSQDMAFINAVASHLAMNMQGPGTSLKSVLRMMAKQHDDTKHNSSARQLLNLAFEEVDINGDGVISKEEFEAAGRRLLAGRRI